MNRLNRKDFKELLTEWKQNFVNERGPIRDFYKKEIPASLCPLGQDEMIELSNFVADLINFYKKRKDLGFDKMEKGNRGFVFNFSVSKDINILKAIFDFSKNSVIKKYVSSSIKEVENGNKDPVVFFVNYGDVTGKEKVKNQEAAPYITHDLEHAVFTSDVFDSEDADRDHGDEKNYDERRSAWNFDRDIDKNLFYNQVTADIAWSVKDDIKKLNKIANKEDIVDVKYTDQESDAIKVELAFKDFFNDINYGKGIGIGDIMPSVWAYCISNMKNKNDLDEVNNSNIHEEHKKIIRYVLKNSHDNCMASLNNFLSSQKDKIVFINSWG